MNASFVNVIGAGLAGVEASWQLAKRGIAVRLYEMKKIHKNPAQTMDTFAELVCSNSFRSDTLLNAAGILKNELRQLGSFVMQCADATSVPAGTSLAVDRERFSALVTKRIQEHSLITVIDAEIQTIPEGYTILATGPLTSEPLALAIRNFTGQESLYFYDAIAPIVEFSSIDMNVAFFKNRYDKGEATYLNCPMTKEQYDAWHEAVVTAECAPIKDFEMKVFDGCMPFEEMARRGRETLLYGPMKPIGLRKPDGTSNYAIVQLRQDNLAKSLYNIVGFQTHLTFPEQKRIIQMIPGLEHANIVRYGVMHRNTYLNAPLVLNAYYQTKKRTNLFFAGQLSGVEGYVESVGSGFVAGFNMARLVLGKPLFAFPQESILGSEAHYLANAEPETFQPMNANFGLLSPLKGIVYKSQRKERYAQRAVATIEQLVREGLLD